MKNSLLILSALLLISCASTPVVPICKELDVDRGYCVWIVGDKEQYVDDENLLDDQSWWDLRPVMIMVPPDSWAKIKSYIIKNCEKHGGCEKSKALEIMEESK